MTAKQRESTSQHWQSVIMRETRDLPSLKRVGAMALQDRDVRSDAALESLIRGHLAQRRADIERETRTDAPATRPAARQRDFAARSPGVHTSWEPPATSQAAPPAPIRPMPDLVQVALDELTDSFREALGRGDERKAGAVYDKLCVHQQEHSGTFPAAALAEHEHRLTDSEDAILCDLFARNAVHAAMAGKTGLVIGFLHDEFIHVPIELLASRRKSIDPTGPIWAGVLVATGQPEHL